MTARSAAPRWLPWAVAGVLASGSLLVSGVIEQQSLQLRGPLATAIPAAAGPLASRDLTISDEERETAGVSDYVMRLYGTGGTEVGELPWISVYVGYYESQTRGKTIHSPKNCMPGSGWDALEAEPALIPVPGGAPVEVNRYMLVKENQRVLVLYWYQGRGRVVASEYRAKWELLRDAALSRRSDEALVRVVVPVQGDEERAFAQAREMAEKILPTITQALPAA